MGTRGAHERTQPGCKGRARWRLHMSEQRTIIGPRTCRDTRNARVRIRCRSDELSGERRGEGPARVGRDMGRRFQARAACAAVLAFWSATRAVAATPEGRSLSAGVDVGVRTARDDLIVPLASTGPALGFGARFVGAVGPGLLDTGVRFQLAALFDRSDHPAASIFHAFRLAYLPVVVNRPGRWSLALGPALVWETD